MYPVPIQTMVALNDTPAGRARLEARDRQLRERDWRNTDPGRGPVRGWGI